MLQFRRHLLPKQGMAKNEYSASNFIPYLTHWNNSTILTGHNELVKIIKVGGFSFETADDEDLEIKCNLRNTLFKSVASSDLVIYLHIVRKKQKAYDESYVSADMPDGFASYLDKKWVNKYKDQKAFANELYITIVHKAAVSKKKGILSRIGGKSRFADAMKDAEENLEDSVGRCINTLKEYSPRVIGLYEEKGLCYSEPLEFLSSLVNLGENRRVIYTPDKANRYFANARLYFDHNIIKAKMSSGKDRFAGMVSVKEYGPKTWAGMLDNFLHLPFEFVITQSFSFTNKQSSVNSMQLQQNRMIQSQDKAISQIVEISDALDKAMSGEIAFGKHHLTVMCMSDDERELESALSVASVEVTNTGCIGVRESVNMEPAFWAQLPGNTDYVVRASTINTLNLAAFASLHNYPSGKKRNNHWGDAVTVLDTTSGTPYYFNFHLRDVGHTTIIGPTGAGKTVMMNFLCAQAQKFGCRLFFFDKDRGAEIFLRALLGEYTAIDPSKDCGFNPLQLEDTGENRTFLLDWLQLLVSVNGEKISAGDSALLAKAIDGNFKLNQEDRILSNIAPFLGLEGPGTLAERLSMWYGDGSHAKVFDNEKDRIDFSISNIFGFEMAELLKDKAALSPVLSYVFHRINMSLDGTPTMIVLDEAWALIDNPVFAPRIKDWLKVLRKLNAFVVFATQSVEDASKSSISDTLIQQTATQIFLPNMKATDVYKSVFMLSDREFSIVKHTDAGSRFFLIKQGMDSVVARIDLSSMPDIIHILSGRADSVLILDKMLEEYGNDPSVWIPMFIAQLQKEP
mgnify:CR=1 FL=1